MAVWVCHSEGLYVVFGLTNPILHMVPFSSTSSPRSSFSSSMMPTAIGLLDSAALYEPVLRMVGRTSSVTHLRNGSDWGARPFRSIW